MIADAHERRAHKNLAVSTLDFRAQIETTMFGPMNVTRAIRPAVRVESWIASLAPELAPCVIRTI